ncbi:hypothetical protein, partial [Lamprobacter modestohalophilus]|uniref:hypothetical protein n=1 Tax=Lamprobacter modestohalophilus TaxID=1064514 RepID=UPI002ADEEC70
MTEFRVLTGNALMDIQQLLATATNQTSTTKPTPGPGLPGIFAHHMALAGLRPDAALTETAAGGKGEGLSAFSSLMGDQPFSSRVAAEDAAKGFAALWRDAWRQGADTEGAGTGAGTELAQLTASITAVLQQAAEGETLASEIGELMQQLPAELREGFVAQREEFVAQMEELFTQLTERLLPEQSAQLIAELTEQLPPEASEQLFARLTEQLSS